MKRIIFTLCGAVLCSLTAIAQPLSITAANAKTYTSTVGKDHMANVNIGASTIPAFTGTNTTWDLTSLTYDTTTHPYRNRLYALFPYDYADSMGHTLGRFTCHEDYLVNNSSLYQISFYQQTDTQDVAINRIGGGIDSATFVDQTNINSHPYVIMPYPCTYGTNWSNNYTHSSTFVLTDTLLHYHRVPAKLYTQISRKDSIIAWGKMRIKEPKVDSTPAQITTYQGVLVEKSIVSESDSFYANGSLFDASLLSGWGISQGMTINTYTISIFRLGRLVPWVQIWYTDSTFTTMSKMWVDTLNFKPSTSVKQTALESDVHIYPNPVVNHNVYIDVPATAGSWSYQMINITGQTLVTENLPAGQTHTLVTLPTTIAPGTYYMMLTNDNIPVCVKPVTINN